MSSLDDDWARSIEAASDALEASRRGGTLPEPELKAASHHLREERKWFAGVRAALGKIVPKRN